MDGILLKSSKYDKRHLVVKNYYRVDRSQSERAKYFEWIIMSIILNAIIGQ